MPINNISDWEMRIKRHDAFWENEIIDRPLVHLSCPSQNTKPIPTSTHASWKERWYDVDFQVNRTLAEIANTHFMGDKLPLAFPNVGPDIFPACYGGEIEFENNTSYIKHFLQNWNKINTLKLSLKREYPQKIEELYDAFFEAGKGIFMLEYQTFIPERTVW